MNLRSFLRTWIVALFLIDHTSVLAQTANDPQSFILPSPSSMTFQKYGDYPVDYSTGVPAINIPVYTIQLKDYSFPISVSFHASGRMAAQNFSPLGMNWALMANGLISREVRGRVDGTTGYHLEKKPDDLLPYTTNYDDLTSIDPENTGSMAKDNEYDIYTLSLSGLSAKFIVKGPNQIVFLEYCPYKVITTGPSAFEVTDDKGVKYVFGTDAAGNGWTELDNSAHCQSAWYVATITTISGSVIQFKYDSQLILPSTFLGNRFLSDQLEIKDYGYANAAAAPSGQFPAYYPTNNAPKQSNVVSGEDFSISYLKEIDFPNGTMAFTYNSTTNNFLLDRIKVTSVWNTVIKNAQFTYFSMLPGTDLYLQNNNSVTLKNIAFQDGANTLVEQYGFDYYPGSAGGDYQNFSKSKDWWGYCNIPSSAKHFPYNTVTFDGTNYNAGGNTSIKNPDFNSKLPGMVKAIHYPTGGTTVFTYEPNLYNNYAGTAVEGPGIRIKQIVSYDGYGHKTGKTYEYGPGTIMREPKAEDYYTRKYYMLLKGTAQTTDFTFNNDFIGSYRYTLYSSEPMPEAQQASRCPVYYQTVTEYEYADDGSNNGRNVYNYTYTNRNTYYNVMSGIGPNSLTYGDGSFYPMVFNFSEWSKPLLSLKLVQKYDAGTSTYKTVASTNMDYVQLNTVTIPQTYIYKYAEFPAESNSFPLTFNCYQMKAVKTYGWPVYSLLDKTISTAVMKPLTEAKVTYDDNGTQLSNSVTYFYDNTTHVNPTRIQSNTSDGKTLTNYLAYPLDYPAGTAFIDTLVSKHIWNPVIENVVTQTTGGVTEVRAGEITTYTGTATYQILKQEITYPLAISSFKFSNRPAGTLPPAGSSTAYAPDSKYVLKQTYSSYSVNNNPRTITPTDNIPVSYIWGYNNTFPIASAKNALYTDIFYTGFEESEANGTAGDCKAGAHSHSGGYTRTLTGLQNGSYVLSYWQKSGSVWVAQNSTVSVTTGSYTMNLTGQVDEIRFYPANAQMTTYTYAPLVGMTSQADINNLTTSYEYDTYQRLMHVRDNDNNILKKYQYSFLNPGYYSTTRTLTLTKNDCDPLIYLGSAVNFTVPEYMFSSTINQADADAQRDAFITQNSQIYANTVGNCYNYKNYAVSQVFTRACSAGLYGTSYTYTVPYGRYTALTLDAANQKALDDINANGQTAANNDPNGNCLTYAQLYKSDAMSHTFTKNCPSGYAAPTYTYSLPYAKYTSANSLQEANDKATQDLYTNGQNTVETYTCSPLPTVTIQVNNNTYYDMTVVFSDVSGPSTFTYTSHAQTNGSMTITSGFTYNVSITPPNSNSFHYYLGSAGTSGSSGHFYNVAPATVLITN